MPLSESANKEIRSELAALHELKVKIEGRVRALEAILVPLDLSQVALPFPAPNPASNGHGEVNPSSEPTRSIYASTGLRAAILDVMRLHREAMRAPEIAGLLEDRGFTNESSTSLSTRVYNDLWRMSQRGLIHKGEEGFSLR